MKTSIPTKLDKGSLIPQFDLPATRGSRAQLWGYKGNLNLVLFFIPDIKSEETHGLLGDIGGHYSDYSAHNAEVLVISKDNIEALDKIAHEMNLPFPLLSDITGSVTDAYTMGKPAVFVVDKFGELYDQDVISEGLDHQAILDWLHLIELECPECGVPTWRV